MSTSIEVSAQPRSPLTRERVLSTAVALADQGGIESLSMRKLAQALDVVPMALYRHVANKDELLNALVDVVIEEIDPPLEGAEWRKALRARILSARRALLRHPWASRLMESRKTPTPIVLGYMDSMIGMFRTGGFSLDLTHHALHAMGSRMFWVHPGAVQRLRGRRCGRGGRCGAMAGTYPHISRSSGDLPRRRIDGGTGLRRSVRVRVRARSDARGPGEAQGPIAILTMPRRALRVIALMLP